MVLSTRKRVMVLGFIFISSMISLTVIVAGRFLNINTQDPLFFDREMYATYEYNDGETDGELKFEVTKIESDYSVCTCSFEDEFEKDFKVTEDGFYLRNSKETTYQTFFWVHIVEGMGSEGRDYTDKEYDIIDPIGIFGNASEKYTLKITENTNYWPQEAPLHGAQASMKFVVYNSDDELVADGLMDATCGLVWKMEIGAASGNLKTMKLVDTNYDISRNRLTGWPWAVALAIITPIACYFLLGKVKKIKVEDKDERVEITALVACGEAAFLFDIFIDVWMYALLGFGGNMIAHLLVLVGFALVCYWKKYGFKWLIPGILEFGFLYGMRFADPNIYVPYLTAFMGLTLSFLGMVIASGYKSQETRSKLGKIVSNFI